MCFLSDSSWDDVYQTELQMFGEHGDEGEVWFGESTSKRVVTYLSSRHSELKNDSVIDLGAYLVVLSYRSSFR